MAAGDAKPSGPRSREREGGAEWVRLTGEKIVSAQLAPKPQGGRPESGINAATRELGIDRTEAQRAVKIDGLTPEAKQAARETGLERNRSVINGNVSYKLLHPTR